MNYSNLKFRDVAHLYLGVDVIVLATGDRLKLNMIGVQDPYPAYCGTAWYGWDEIKPVLISDEELPAALKKRLDDQIPNSDPQIWCKMTLFYGRHGIDMFDLIERGEAFGISTTTP